MEKTGLRAGQEESASGGVDRRPATGRGAQDWQNRPDPTFRVTLPFSERRVLLAIGDACVVNTAVVAALYIWAVVGGNLPFGLEDLRANWIWFPTLTVLWWFLARLTDLYDVAVAGRRLDVTQRVGIAGISLLMVYLVTYFFLRGALPRIFFLCFAVLVLVGIWLWRWTYATVFALPPFRQRVLIAGAGSAGCTMAQLLGSLESEYNVIGFVDDDPEKQSQAVAGLPILGGSCDLPTLVRERRVDKVVVAVTHQMGGELFQALIDCHTAGVHVVSMPVQYEQLTRRIPVEHVERGWVIASMNDLSALERPARWIKRLLDLALGGIGMLTLLLLLPFLAPAIALDSRGPVFYRQVRLGQGGRPFAVLKLRTMIASAESDGKPRWASENDARITRTGRILRKTRLDELPQVLNVLRGEMSMVGPRPERPEFIHDLQDQIPFYRTRLCVRPGLTGWAQVHYEYGNSVEDALIKLQYDLYYIRHWSLWLDLYVIFKTVGVVLRGGGT
ncbi:MAG: sugar transferase [Anaerolineae bacterium]|nr:sugar transferase [Anaerolineae bacterium]